MNFRTLLIAGLCQCAFALGGCATIVPPSPGFPDRLDVENYASLRADDDAIDKKPPSPSVTSVQYRDAGFGFARNKCVAYFDALTKLRGNEKVARGSVEQVGNLANTILTIAKAGTVAIGVTDAAFAAGKNTFDNIEKLAVFSEFEPEARKLTLAALDAYEEKVRSKNVPASGDYITARRLVEGYAALCTESSIDDFLHQATANDKAVPAEDAGKDKGKAKAKAKGKSDGKGAMREFDWKQRRTDATASPVPSIVIVPQ